MARNIEREKGTSTSGDCIIMNLDVMQSSEKCSSQDAKDFLELSIMQFD
jgi:hypothetical protein